MSSLAASRADNFYHPPEWDPQKISRDKYQGSKGSNQWEQYGVIRFEMPYNIWCGGCKKHIRQGTRFNAKKDTVGKYFSTNIYAFTMKCACCPQKIVIETDPKNCDYVVASGGRQKIETYTEEDAKVEHLDTNEHKNKVAADPFYKLEHENRDQAVVREAKPRLSQLIDLRDRQRSDDFSTSQKLRKNLRQRKREDVAHADARARSSAPMVRMLPASNEDQTRASLVVFKKTRRSGFQQNHIAKRAKISASSIFGTSSNDARAAALVKWKTRGVDTSIFAQQSPRGAPERQLPLPRIKLVPKKRVDRCAGASAV